jgi:hypothetical protein
MSGAIPPLPQYAFMAWCSVRRSTGTTLQRLYVHARSVSPGTVQQVMPTVLMAVVCLTATKFEPFIFPMLGFVFAYVSNIYIIVSLYDLPASYIFLLCNRERTESGMYYAKRRSVCALVGYQ